MHGVNVFAPTLFLLLLQSCEDTVQVGGAPSVASIWFHGRGCDRTIGAALAGTLGRRLRFSRNSCWRRAQDLQPAGEGSQ